MKCPICETVLRLGTKQCPRCGGIIGVPKQATTSPTPKRKIGTAPVHKDKFDVKSASKPSVRVCPRCNDPMPVGRADCPKCKNISCPACGMPAEAGQTECIMCNSTITIVDEDALRTPPAPSHLKSLKVPIIIGGAALLILISIVVLIISLGNGEKPPPPPSVETVPLPTEAPPEKKVFTLDDCKSQVNDIHARIETASTRIAEDVDLTAAQAEYESALNLLTQLKHTVQNQERVAEEVELEIKTIEKSLEDLCYRMDEKRRIIQANQDLANALEASSQDRHEDAIRYFMSYLEREPEAEIALTGVAMSYLALNALPQAEEYFLKAYEVNPNNLEVNRQLSDIAYSQRDLDRAYQYLENILRLSPSDEKALYTTAVILRGRGTYNEAIERLTKLINVAPDNSSFRLRAHKQLGDLYRLIGINDQARLNYERYIALGPDAIYAALVKEHIEILRGNDSHLKSDFLYLKDGTVQEGKVLEESASSIRFEIAKVGIRYPVRREEILEIKRDVLNDYGKALLEYVRRLDAIADDDVEAHFELGMWCLETGVAEMKPHAIEEFKLVLSYRADHQGAWEQLKRLGIVKEEAEVTEATEEESKGLPSEFQTAESPAQPAGPSPAQKELDEAIEFLAQGKYDKALSSLRDAKNKDSKNLKVRDLLTYVLMIQKKWKEARREAEELKKEAAAQGNQDMVSKAEAYLEQINRQ